MSSERHDGTQDTAGKGAKRLAHERALETDLTNHFKRGNHIEVFIETPPERNGGGAAVARVDRPPSVHDAIVFVEPGPLSLHRGSRVQGRIRTVDENFLKVIGQYRLD